MAPFTRVDVAILWGHFSSVTP